MPRVLHFSSLFTVAAEVVITAFQHLPCPQTLEFQCQIMNGTTTLTWSLPNGVELEFGVGRNVGYIRNSSDNIYSATLTGKTEDNDPNTDRFFFTSTLLVLQPVNGSTLTCGGAVGLETVQNSTTITLSGMYVCLLSITKRRHCG